MSMDMSLYIYYLFVYTFIYTPVNIKKMLQIAGNMYMEIDISTVKVSQNIKWNKIYRMYRSIIKSTFIFIILKTMPVLHQNIP